MGVAETIAVMVRQKAPGRIVYSCGATVAQCHRTFQRSSLTGRSTQFAPAPTHGQRHERTGFGEERIAERTEPDGSDEARWRSAGTTRKVLVAAALPEHLSSAAHLSSSAVHTEAESDQP